MRWRAAPVSFTLSSSSPAWRRTSGLGSPCKDGGRSGMEGGMEGGMECQRQQVGWGKRATQGGSLGGSRL